MNAKISIQMVKNVIHSIATYKRKGCFVTFNEYGWMTAKY